MKKGFYYIRTKQHGEENAVKINGYIIPDLVSGLTFGARFRAGSGWEVTELSTGLLISYGEKKPKNQSDILPFIDRIRPAVLSAMKSHGESTIEHFNDLIRKTKENETK